MVLIGCSTTPPPPSPNSSACLAALEARGISFAPWAAPRQGKCVVDTPVRASKARIAIFQPELKTSCQILLAWTDFEGDVDRLARQYMGSPLVAVLHYGSYSCRMMTGNSGRLSLHAQAKALDIAGFRLRNGTVIKVQSAWRGRMPDRQFIRAVARDACRRFNVVLTPDSDGYHQDHIHVDVGPWRVCGRRS